MDTGGDREVVSLAPAFIDTSGSGAAAAAADQAPPPYAGAGQDQPPARPAIPTPTPASVLQQKSKKKKLAKYGNCVLTDVRTVGHSGDVRHDLVEEQFLRAAIAHVVIMIDRERMPPMDYLLKTLRKGAPEAMKRNHFSKKAAVSNRARELAGRRHASRAQHDQAFAALRRNRRAADPNATGKTGDKSKGAQGQAGAAASSADATAGPTEEVKGAAAGVSSTSGAPSAATPATAGTTAAAADGEGGKPEEGGEGQTDELGRKRSYTCEICFKVFQWSGNMSRHRRVHSGAKPYSCKYCHTKFNNSSNRNKHERNQICRRRALRRAISPDRSQDPRNAGAQAAAVAAAAAQMPYGGQMYPMQVPGQPGAVMMPVMPGQGLPQGVQPMLGQQAHQMMPGYPHQPMVYMPPAAMVPPGGNYVYPPMAGTTQPHQMAYAAQIAAAHHHQQQQQQQHQAAAAAAMGGMVSASGVATSPSAGVPPAAAIIPGRDDADSDGARGASPGL